MPLIQQNDTKLKLLGNGAISKITVNGIMVNQIVGNELDGSFGNLFLRVFKNGQTSFHPLTGPRSNSTVTYTDDSVSWTGKFDSIKYTVRLLVTEAAWFWETKLSGPQQVKAELTYTQDLGLGEESFVSTNEAYASQYIDRFVTQQDGKITLSSRQNQIQKENYPYLQEGSFSELDSYSTDGFQFFGPQYKASSVPRAFVTEKLDNYNKQYECSYTALRTKRLKMTATPTKVVFYAAYKDSQPQGNLEHLFNPIELEEKYAKAQANGTQRELKPVKSCYSLGTDLVGEKLDDQELDKLFPHKKQVEKHQGQLLSFFTNSGAHVVLPAKEKIQERLSGNIVLTKTATMPGTPVMAATQYMPGLFESHVVFGNSDMNILSTNPRDELNVFKANGTRIYLKVNGKYRILGMPSIFVMHYNGADWYYKIGKNLLKISGDASADGDQLTLSFTSQNEERYSVLVTTQLESKTLGEEPDYRIEKGEFIVFPQDKQAMKKQDPTLGYRIAHEKNDAKNLSLSDDDRFFTGRLEEKPHLLVSSYTEVSSFTIKTGLSTAELQDEETETTRIKHNKSLVEFLHYFALATNSTAKKDLVERTNLVLPWFTHDALVHLLSPHGLEQYGGAAWGTRDVAQGPTELFLATNHYAEVREIILRLYSHQFVEDGNWPQWFMFDEYSGVFADESHGDVIVWPLKVVADYLLATHDDGILDEKLPYMSSAEHKMTEDTASLREHLNKQIAYIENHFLYDTRVSAYGDGDWDDTLQPADPRQKETMSSTWTEELTIETFNKAALAFSKETDLASHCASLASAMMSDFVKYFMQSETLPGFIQMAPDHQIEQLIYPGDKKTRIDYRLLPLSQGVLSHILSDEQAECALNLIKEKLLYPDGVRLMSQPATYHGGVSQIFKRAEQSANFGREIGLLYVHAHIRYAAAVAITGQYQEAWRLLDLVNPINLPNRIKNAEVRQANVYFSSSDADFDTRYQAQENFDKVKKQEVGVKGGWRLYSSGPGIFIGTLLMDVLSLQKLTGGRAGQYELPFDGEITVSYTD
ncbi:GH36-type glycosyl hydrolase domain-containing protein [Ligilactobacillus acidipiscis]|uniref:GH36-type glycosyl hydrolase domain-containing protein n=1 Tax=Ligilactobacillus acidipiscis TaxID=89059 RepID=UPI0023F90238|nr:amylo-alpha-1,6-glucosidase [Ligilactobacillus acidipiscis]WEV57045.1 cellobiose phosphorylase [Ligilactobacillus acidipiscis]